MSLSLADACIAVFSPRVQLTVARSRATREHVVPRNVSHRTVTVLPVVRTQRGRALHRKFLLIDDDPRRLDCLAALLRGDGVEVCRF